MYTLKLTPEEAGVLRAMLNHYDRLMATLPTPSFDCTAEDRHSMRRKLRDMEPDEEPAWKMNFEFELADDPEWPEEAGAMVEVDTYAECSDGRTYILGLHAQMNEDDANHLMATIADAGVHA